MNPAYNENRDVTSYLVRKVSLKILNSGVIVKTFTHDLTIIKLCLILLYYHAEVVGGEPCFAQKFPVAIFICAALFTEDTMSLT